MIQARRPDVRVDMGRWREIIGVGLGIALVIGVTLYLAYVIRPSLARTRVQVLAHRGASAYAPENTLASFRLAAEQRADWLEFDVQQTRDGRLVVFHDIRLERTTNGRGFLRDTTLDQLKELDAGAWFRSDFAREPVPTFEEVVEFAKSANVQIFPEVKEPRFGPGIEERVAAVLRAYDYEDRTIVQSFDDKSLERLRAINPKLRLALLFGRENPLRGEPPAGVEVIGPEWNLILADKSLVRDAHIAGRQVVVWTVDAIPTTRQMIDARVDGIITNRPDMIRALLDER